MSDQYVGEIRMFAGDYPPQDWLFCAGQTLLIDENEALYSLIGTTYGGDGQTNFKLPDLRGRAPIHQSSQYYLGSMGGLEQVTLTQQHLPTHTHVAQANNQPSQSTSNVPSGNYWGYSSITNYQTGITNSYMSPAAIANAGGNVSHDNMMPSFVINFIIAIRGLYPIES